MYSNGYVPAFGKEDDRSNPRVLATQTGYFEIWENKVQTNISLEQKLDFITKDCVLKVVLVSTLTTQTKLAVKNASNMARRRFEILMGKLLFKEQRTEEKMTQSSISTGNRTEFLRSNFTLQSCIQSASRRWYFKI